MSEATGSGLAFRPAGSADWSEIWPVVREVVAAGDTYMYPPDLDEARARAAWLLDGTGRRVTYVATDGGAVLATAKLLPNHDGPGDHVANAAWMVAPWASGRGIGRRFAEFVLGEARRLGFSAMQFNAVVDTNERAIALWRSLGFEIVGTVPDAFRHPDAGLVPIHVMYRTL